MLRDDSAPGTKMSELTDPAREIVDTILSIQGKHQDTGEKVLSDNFSLPVWSSGFYQILFHINTRIEELAASVLKLDLDEDFKRDAVAHLMEIQQAFGPNGLRNHWQHTLANFLSPENVNPIKFLSPLIRSKISYPKLTDEEVADVQAQCEELLTWLEEHQAAKHDFIRQALIEGLLNLNFRLLHFQWLGWGYCIKSLREVISAYMALEQAAPSLDSELVSSAMMQKTRTFLSNTFKIMKVAKDLDDVAGLSLKMYGAVSAVAQGKSIISGLLTHTQP
ncbi:hypothetical protein ACFQU7_16235 [Pseudoroseomonas wenyumeiae]